MARREGRGSRRDEGQKAARSGNSLFTGLLIGLALGMAMAAAVAWYLNMTVSPVQEAEKATASAPGEEEPEPPAAKAPEPPAPPPPPRKAAAEEKPTAPKPLAKRPPKPEAAPAPPPKVNYTFYGILPGDRPARPMEPPPSKDTWWLQIAALSDPRKAEQIRARLAMLNLRASTQKIESNGQPLYRIRVGPYQREDDAFGDLDILTENEFHARLLKDPVNSK